MYFVFAEFHILRKSLKIPECHYENHKRKIVKIFLKVETMLIVRLFPFMWRNNTLAIFDKIFYDLMESSVFKPSSI